MARAHGGSRPRVVVVGAGVGGLAAAARLARQGCEVQLFEKTAGPGGRCNRLEAEGFGWDVGPTFLLMPEVFEETFRALGRRLEDCLPLLRCEPNYRVHFRDGSRLTFTSELTRLGRELEALEAGSFERLLAFLARGRAQYTAALGHLVGRNYRGVSDYLRPALLRQVLRSGAHRSLHAHVARYFRDERLRAAFTFQSMYLGVSPYSAPAVFGLLPFCELGVGVWMPKGGLYALPLALERAAREEGVRLHYGQPVERIRVEGGRTRRVRLAGGEEVEADAVVCNADLPWAYAHLLDPAEARLPRAGRLRYTSSGYMLYLGLRRPVEGLGHHSVFLGAHYRESFSDIFERRRVPDDVSFYVCAPSRTDPSLAPPGRDALYVLVPVPHQHPGLDWRTEGPRVRARVFARLAEEGLGRLEEDVVVERRFTPDDWAATYNLAHGSAFGLAQNFLQIGPLRPANQDPRVRNLFFVGASTQPGTGLPTVLISARLVCERVAAWAREEGLPTLAPLPAAAGQEVAA